MTTCYKPSLCVLVLCVCACVCFPPHHSLQGIFYFLFVKLQDKKMIHKHNSFIFVMWNLIIRVKGKKADGIPASLWEGATSSGRLVVRAGRGSPLGRATDYPADPVGAHAPASRVEKHLLLGMSVRYSASLPRYLRRGSAFSKPVGSMHLKQQCTAGPRIDCHPVISVPAQWCKVFRYPPLGYHSLPPPSLSSHTVSIGPWLTSQHS